jgi:hypothetical protein
VLCQFPGPPSVTLGPMNGGHTWWARRVHPHSIANYLREKIEDVREARVRLLLFLAERDERFDACGPTGRHVRR